MPPTPLGVVLPILPPVAPGVVDSGVVVGLEPELIEPVDGADGDIDDEDEPEVPDEEVPDDVVSVEEGAGVEEAGAVVVDEVEGAVELSAFGASVRLQAPSAARVAAIAKNTPTQQGPAMTPQTPQ